jgi:hypothetical protein
VTGVALWAAIFAVGQAAAIVYKKPMDDMLKKVQIAIFALSGPLLGPRPTRGLAPPGPPWPPSASPLAHTLTSLLPTHLPTY